MSLDHLLMRNTSSLMANSSSPGPVPIKSEPLDHPSSLGSSIPLDPSLNLSMPATTVASSNHPSTTAAGPTLLAAYNRFNVAIAPKPSAPFTNLDILVPHPQQAHPTSQAAPNRKLQSNLNEHVEMSDSQFPDAVPQPQPRHHQLGTLLTYTDPTPPPSPPLQTHPQPPHSLPTHPNPPDQPNHSPLIKPRTANTNPQPLTTLNKPQLSSGRRKNSSEHSTEPRKSVVRIKPIEQLEAEALIEKQNPNATRNQLRSLKLRALHAGRIAERELGMSEEEKARRLRLREYVRKKRADEREEKLKAKTELIENGALPLSTDNPTKATVAGANKPGKKTGAANINPRLAIQASHDPSLFGISAATASDSAGTTHRIQSKPETIPHWHDPVLHTPQRSLNPMSNTPASAPTTFVTTAPVKRKRASEPGASQPRRKSTSRLKTAEQTALEAQIERENPTATKNQLKSLKLRALHAGRIAERERDMPEKEKARRLKLREYMRRRREEERGEGVLKPELPVPVTTTTSSSNHIGTITELNAADRSAAFSIMGLNNHHHGFLQHLSTPPVVTAAAATTAAADVIPVSQTNHNLHLHPLFQMPLPSAVSTLPATTAPTHHYDSSINSDPTTSNANDTNKTNNNNNNYADVWSLLPSSTSSGSGLLGTEDLQQPVVGSAPLTNEQAERALHAAIEEVIGIQELDHRAAALEQERIRIAEEEILGIERARIADAQLEIIKAAAAAEAEFASSSGGASAGPAGLGDAPGELNHDPGNSAVKLK